MPGQQWEQEEGESQLGGRAQGARGVEALTNADCVTAGAARQLSLWGQLIHSVENTVPEY